MPVTQFTPLWRPIYSGPGDLVGRWYNNGPVVTVTDGKRALTAQSNTAHEDLAYALLAELIRIAQNVNPQSEAAGDSD